MPIDWSPFVEYVRKHERFLLMTHVRPDGDALGSELALCDALERLGKTVRVVIASVFPPRYRFLDPDSKRVHRFDAKDPIYATFDAIIIVDTGTYSQLGDFGDWMKTAKIDKAVIDHHVTQDDLGAVRFQDTSAESCARLIDEAIRALALPHTKASAEHVFMGLSMDTGWFHHSNTSARSFELAKQLIEAGADANALYSTLYESNTVPRMKLLGRVLDRLKAGAGGRWAYSFVLRNDYEELGAVPGDTEDAIDLIRGIAGVEVSVMLLEQPGGGVKISFRSRGRVNVAQIAEKFGGGGHKLACGASLPDPIEDAIRTIVAAVEKAL